MEAVFLLFAADQTPVASSPLQILLAEDNALNQRITKLLVAKLGHDIEVVSDGALAVEAAKRTHYEVILMDIAMPNMDGLEATRRILAHYGDAFDRPYIVALTASGDRAACVAAGMDDYVPKPVRMADLADALAQALTTAATWRNQRHKPNDV